MRPIKICRVFGLTVQADWTLLILFVLLGTSFSQQLMARYEDASLVTAALVSVAFALLFVFSIFLHEMGHVFVGRRFGVPFRTITLFIFGGAAHMERLPPRPKAEALMALAGPATSILFAIALFVASVLYSLVFGVPQASPIFSLIVTLSTINVILGVFNLAPAFPLDGGRVFRAFMWHRNKSFLKATEIAAGFSKGFAFAMIGMAVLMALGASFPFFGGGLSSAIWMGLLGWLIMSMAKQELLMTRALAREGRL